MSWPPAATPFFTTDQNGSLAWPWLTTMMRVFCAAAGTTAARVRAAAAARPVMKDFMLFLPLISVVHRSLLAAMDVSGIAACLTGQRENK